MRQFFKFLFASFFGTLLALFLGVMLIVGVFVVLNKASESRKHGVAVENASVLQINIEGPVVEKLNEWDYSLGLLERYPRVALTDISNALLRAAEDKQIKGVYLKISNNQMGFADASSLMREIDQFKKSKKFVIGYGVTLTERDYLLASACDSFYLYPQGGMEWDGLALTPLYFKGAIDKFGLEVDVFRAGKFKSAIEPFIRTNMSEEDRVQLQTILGDIWGQVLRRAERVSHKSPEELNQWAQELKVQRSPDAKALGLVTDVWSENQTLDLLKKKVNFVDEGEGDTPLVQLSDYLGSSQSTQKGPLTSHIAVLVLEGEIRDGQGDDGIIGGDETIEMIRELRDDRQVKGVILRINSPGGSALASDLIWAEIESLKKVKPVYASFRNVAASGGYYIAAGAQKIFAEPTTLTGSIGVFGLSFKVHELLKDKLGITSDRVVTHTSSDLENPFRSFSEQEKQKIQESVEHTYNRFKEVVALGRPLKSVENVEPRASGRVWSGLSAQKEQLVDEMGGLRSAILSMSSQLKMDSRDVQFYPEDSNPVFSVLKTMGLVKAKVQLHEVVGPFMTHLLETAQKAQENQNHVLAWYPQSLEIK